MFDKKKYDPKILEKLRISLVRVLGLISMQLTNIIATLISKFKTHLMEPVLTEPAITAACWMQMFQTLRKNIIICRILL